MTYKNKDGIYVISDSLSKDRSYFEGDLKRVVKFFEDMIDEAKKLGALGEGSFEISTSGDDYYGYDTYIIYNFEREENEKEKKIRLSMEAKEKKLAADRRKRKEEIKKKKEAEEYSEFLRLKEKFENK